MTQNIFDQMKYEADTKVLRKKMEAQKKEKGEMEKDNVQLKRDVESLMRRNMEISKKERQVSLNKSRGSPDSRLEF